MVLILPLIFNSSIPFSRQPNRLEPWYTLAGSLPMGKTSNESHGYDITPFDGEAQAVELWGIWSTSSFPLLPDPLWLGVVASDRVLSIGQIELFYI